MIDPHGAAWAAWQKALSGAEPVLEPERPARWRLGQLDIACASDASGALALEVRTTSRLAVWALRRAASPSTALALATGDASFDGEVLLLGDERVVAVLDGPTRESVRGLVAGRRLCLEGGVVRLDALAAGALAADQIAATLARMTALAGRLDRAVEAFDEELSALLASERLPAVRAAIAQRFPRHPAVVRAKVTALVDRADGPGAGADLGALVAIVEDLELPSAERLRASRTALELLANAPGQAIAVEEQALLARLASVPSLPAKLRASAFERLLAGAPLTAIERVPSELWLRHADTVVEAMRRSDADRQAGARCFERAAAARGDVIALMNGGLGPEDLAFLAGALAEIGAPALARRALVDAWRQRPTDALVASIVPTLVAIGADLGELLAELDENTFRHAVDALPRIAPQLTDGVLVLDALYPHLSDAGDLRDAVVALGGLGDARATETLVAALASTHDGVVDAAIEALGRVGDLSALKHLQRHAEGLFRDRGRKALARAAIDRIRERVGDPEHGLSLAADSGGGLALSDREGR